MQAVHDFARKYFSIESLRPAQEQVIRQVLNKRSSIAALPTGYGKSLCYQLPALMQAWKTIVVFPLLVLLQEQKQALESKGMRVLDFHSLATGTQRQQNYAYLKRGDWDIILVSPERLQIWLENGIWSRLQAQINFFVIDEAHCCLEWRSFRSAYQTLDQIVAACSRSGITILALSATLSLSDIQTLAALWQTPLQVVREDIGRRNIYLEVRAFTEARERYTQLFACLRELEKPNSAIIYCGTRKESESLAVFLTAAQYPAMAYHAGLNIALRNNCYAAFVHGQARIICATTAFGMGINSPHVERVIHWGPSYNLESYWQEVGRAGRANQPAYAFLLWNRSDQIRLRKILAKPDLENSENKKKFSKFLQFLRTKNCRRKIIADHFNYTTSSCGNCDNCLRKFSLPSPCYWDHQQFFPQQPWWIDDKIRNSKNIFSRYS